MCSWGLSDIIDSIEVWVVGSKDSTEVLVIDSISHGGKTFREHCVSYHSVFLCVCVGGGYMYMCGDSWTAASLVVVCSGGGDGDGV